MGMTMTQKILAAHAELDEVHAGQLIEAKLDMAMSNDITAPPAILELEKQGLKTLFDTEKIAMLPDHYTPNKDMRAAENCRIMREYATEKGITHYYEVGEVGIEHAFMPEQGLVVAGDLLVGADSHTCTYGALGAFSTGIGQTDIAACMVTGKGWFKVPSAIKFVIKGDKPPFINGKDVILHIIGMIGVDGATYKSMEYTGPGVANLTMDDRFTISNMAIEAGAKNGIFPVDELTKEYLAEHAPDKEYKIYEADTDAKYEAVYEIDLNTLRPTVAFPFLPSNTRVIDEVGEVKIDQAVIGGCTNGRISDMQVAAEILDGHKVAKGIRVLIFPGTPKIYRECLDRGYMKIFAEAGAIICPPSCGVCMGGHMGVLAKGERAISTTNRNFVGRMGHPESEVYLASPQVAAASAITGYISNPEKIGRKS